MQGPAEAGGEPASTTWRPSEFLSLHWRDWGGDSVVYDDCSGQTHQLTPLASAAMAWLEERPRSAQDLTAAIAGDLGVDADADLRRAVDAAIEQFRELDWIEPLTPP